MSAIDWLARISNLHLYHAKHGRAPHKPLLLLVVLELAERAELPPHRMWLTPELAFRFNSFWHVIAHRRTQAPDARMPFHHLGSDEKRWSYPTACRPIGRSNRAGME